MKKRKIRPKPPEPPFGLDMSPDEALRRFIMADPKEVESNITRSKKKKPLGGKKKPSSGQVDQENVVSLRHRRMAKRNYGR